MKAVGRNVSGQMLGMRSNFPMHEAHVRSMFRTSAKVGGVKCDWFAVNQEDLENECGVRIWLDELQKQHPAIAATQVKKK